MCSTFPYGEISGQELGLEAHNTDNVFLGCHRLCLAFFHQIFSLILVNEVKYINRKDCRSLEAKSGRRGQKGRGARARLSESTR